MHDDHELPSNPGHNPIFADVLDRLLSRRQALGVGLGALAVGFLGRDAGRAAAGTAGSPLFTFDRVRVSSADDVCVPQHYEARVLYRWGDPIDGHLPGFQPNASNDAADQALQAGMGHDGMEWFALPSEGGAPDAQRSDAGILAINHEYVDQGLLCKGGIADSTGEAGFHKSQAAHGVSIVYVERDEDRLWSVKPSKFTRRITATTEMEFTGPAVASLGQGVRGTVNNCAAGRTPWGTYLTCEENFNGYFGSAQQDPMLTKDHLRYGFSATGQQGTLHGQKQSLYRWWEHDARFDLAAAGCDAERFGYVVEIDPYDPTSRPRKHTALGRIKHENAAVTLARDGRVVVYMGDDEKNEYIYKFVSAGRYQEGSDHRAANMELLTDGTLYVAQFRDDGEGEWLELTHGKNGLTAENKFPSQASISIRTRQAADRAGATMMDRPEWVAVDPRHDATHVYTTLTNNDLRGKNPPSANPPDGTAIAGKSQPPVDDANPRPNNVYGHIIHWVEKDGDAAATTFDWDVFLLAGDPLFDAKVSPGCDPFACPDGLRFDPRGILWIQTDVSAKVLGRGGFVNLGNNQMLAADPSTGEVRRFLTGPKACEVTGMAMTPDLKTMFVNIQHPGEPDDDITDHDKPRAVSNWPDFHTDGRPRAATLVITREDGGEIGT